MEDHLMDWNQFVELARSMGLKMFGSNVIKVSLTLENGLESVLPIPPRVCDRVLVTPWHSKDFRQVDWPGIGRFYLTPKQALVIKALWQCRETGLGELSGQELLRASDSDGNKIFDLFRNSPAWQNLILSTRKGLYHLPRQ